jgi:hypothetical protein
MEERELTAKMHWEGKELSEDITIYMFFRLRQNSLNV